MGLRTRLARWLNGPGTSAPDASATVAKPVVIDLGIFEKLCARIDQQLMARVEKLELDRPAFVTQLEAMFDACEEVLDRAEAKRARVAAKESRARKREEPDAEQLVEPADRESMKAQVRARLFAMGKP